MKVLRGTLAIGIVIAAIAFGLMGASQTKAAVPVVQSQEAEGYAGNQVCRTCHEESFNKWLKTAMGKAFTDHPKTSLESRGCESCHGPGRAHAEGGGDLKAIIRFSKKEDRPADEINGQCIACHQKGTRLFWQGSTHESRGVTCVSCHQVMQPNVPSFRMTEPLTRNRQFVKQTTTEVCLQCHQLRRAEIQRSSHMPFREGKVACTDCHNPHGGPNPKLLTESTVNENCYKCHSERRGPFLWEHAPVVENCTTCHNAHGSSRPQLLKATMPRLCQECHNEARHPTTPQLATTRFNFNRGCTNCHSQIHGSNHPAGVRLQR